MTPLEWIEKAVIECDMHRKSIEHSKGVCPNVMRGIMEDALAEKVAEGENGDQHKDQELALLRQLEGQAVERRAMEPKHSREDHECEECEVLAELRVLRRSQKA